MNYLHVYIRLIEKRRQFPLNKTPGICGEVEYHHIIPIKCDGDPTPRKQAYNQFGTNLVCMTVKEHFVAHHLLTKIYENTKYAIPAMNAFNLMAQMRTDKITGKCNRIRVSSRIYEALKKHAAEQMSIRMKGRIPWNKGKKLTECQKRNMIGRKLSDEQKQKLRNRKYSEEARRKMSESRKGRKTWNKGLKMSDAFRQKCSEVHKGIRYKPHSEESKKKVSQRRKNTKYITNGIIIKEIKETDPLPNGFWYGRK